MPDIFSDSVSPFAFLAKSRAAFMTKGSFIRVRDWAGTLVASRRPLVVAGTGASNTVRKASSELRLACL